MGAWFDAYVSINETRNIVRSGAVAMSDDMALDLQSLVSMNFWCYPQEFISVLKDGFPEFLLASNYPDKDEYLLPIIADNMMRKGTEYKVIQTSDCWFGVTYQEDRDFVINSFRILIDNGVYSRDLYMDIS